MRKGMKFGMWALGLLLFATLYFLLTPSRVKVGTWPDFSNDNGDSWANGYYRPISVTNSTGGALTNYQVKITFTTAALGNPYRHIRADGSDIRFATNPPPNSGTELSYWIESWGVTGTSSIWVKVPSLPAGNSNIYMYYGNDYATSSSNGTNTFAFFDDFPGTSLNTSWTATSIGTNLTNSVADDLVTVTVVHTAAKGTPVYGFYYGPSFSPPMALRIKQIDNHSGRCYPGGFGFGDYTKTHLGVFKGIETCNNYYFLTLLNSDRATGSSAIPDDDNWHIWDILWTSSQVNFLRDGSSQFTSTTNIPTSPNPVTIGNLGDGGDNGADSDTIVDWIFCRQYAAPEPATGAPGAEAQYPPTK